MRSDIERTSVRVDASRDALRCCYRCDVRDNKITHGQYLELVSCHSGTDGETPHIHAASEIVSRQ